MLCTGPAGYAFKYVLLSTGHRRGLYEKKIHIKGCYMGSLWILKGCMFPGIFAKRYDVSGLKCIFANGSGRIYKS